MLRRRSSNHHQKEVRLLGLPLQDVSLVISFTWVDSSFCNPQMEIDDEAPDP